MLSFLKKSNSLHITTLGEIWIKCECLINIFKKVRMSWFKVSLLNQIYPSFSRSIYRLNGSSFKNHIAVTYISWKICITMVTKWEASSSVRQLTLGVGLPVTSHSNVRLPPSWILCWEDTIVTSGRPGSNRGDRISTGCHCGGTMKSKAKLFLFLKS